MAISLLIESFDPSICRNQNQSIGSNVQESVNSRKKRINHPLEPKTNRVPHEQKPNTTAFTKQTGNTIAGSENAMHATDNRNGRINAKIAPDKDKETEMIPNNA